MMLAGYNVLCMVYVCLAYTEVNVISEAFIKDIGLCMVVFIEANLIL